MFWNRGILALLILLVIASISWFATSGSPTSLDPYEALNLIHGNTYIPPDLVITSGETTTSNLNNFTGQNLIIHFWGLSCPSCKPELKTLNALEKAADAADITFLPIFGGLPDEETDARNYLSTLSATFPCWIAAPSTSRDSFLQYGLPVTYFVLSNGEIIARAVGARDWSSYTDLDLLIKTLFAHH